MIYIVLKIKQQSLSDKFMWFGIILTYDIDINNNASWFHGSQVFQRIQ